MNTDPHQWQERHSPTEEALVYETDGKRTTRQYVRIRSDQMWLNNLDPHQRELADTLKQGWMIMASGLGAKSQQFARSSPGRSGDLTKAQVNAYLDYSSWRRRIKLRKEIDTGPIWDLLFYGHGMRAVEKMYRKRNGSLMAVVIEALEV